MYILTRINYRLLNCHWIFVLAAIFYEAYAWTSPLSVWPVMIAAILFYWVIYTWPRRWVLDLFLVWCGLAAVIRFLLTTSAVKVLIER